MGTAHSAYFDLLQKIIVNQNMLTGYFYIKMHILLIWNLTASHHFMLYAKNTPFSIFCRLLSVEGVLTIREIRLK